MVYTVTHSVIQIVSNLASLGGAKIFQTLHQLVIQKTLLRLAIQKFQTLLHLVIQKVSNLVSISETKSLHHSVVQNLASFVDTNLVSLGGTETFKSCVSQWYKKLKPWWYEKFNLVLLGDTKGFKLCITRWYKKLVIQKVQTLRYSVVHKVLDLGDTK